MILEISDGKADMKVPVAVAAGRKKTVKVRPRNSLLKAMTARSKTKLSVRSSPRRPAKKVKDG